MEGRGRQAASHMDLDAPRQGCTSPGYEVHLPKYLHSLQVHEDKIEMHTSLQVYMCEVNGQEKYAILNYMYVQFVHSFIHSGHLYSASSRSLLRGAPSPATAKQKGL